MKKSKQEAVLENFSASQDSAELADLRYVSDTGPGYARRRRGKGFIITDNDGNIVKDDSVIERINLLVIPPAWDDVWICKTKNGHIQATGRDAKGRKQYIYHPRWDEIRNETKFYRLIKFGEQLPRIRKRIEKDLKKKRLSREKVLAVIIRLLEETLIRIGKTLIRIGNQKYILNGSYGLTTLKNKHVVTNGFGFRLLFNGKSGKEWQIDISDRRLAGIVKQCQDLPGQELFQYLDHENNPHSVSSSDVNNYLLELTGENFTAKDFRTWGGTILAAKELYLLGPSETEKEKKVKINSAVKTVCKVLNNTPKICREYYIHPSIFLSFEDNSLFPVMNNSNSKSISTTGRLSPEEKSVLKLLKSKS